MANNKGNGFLFSPEGVQYPGAGFHKRDEFTDLRADGHPASALMDMMREETYAGFLEEIPVPEVHEDENGMKTTKGLTYSDVALMMTQFKGAVNRFFQSRR